MTSFANLDSHVDLTSYFDGLRGTHIPYGSYAYTLLPIPPSTSSAVITERVRVSRPETFSITRIPSYPGAGRAAIDSRTPAGFVINGKLEPMPAVASTLAGQEELVWIRLSPVVGDFPNRSGQFRIYTSLAGRFLLVVNRGNEVLHFQLVEFQQRLTTPKAFVVRLEKIPEALYVR